MKTNITEQLAWYKKNIENQCMVSARSYTIYIPDDPSTHLSVSHSHSTTTPQRTAGAARPSPTAQPTSFNNSSATNNYNASVTRPTFNANITTNQTNHTSRTDRPLVQGIGDKRPLPASLSTAPLYPRSDNVIHAGVDNSNGLPLSSKRPKHTTIGSTMNKSNNPGTLPDLAKEQMDDRSLFEYDDDFGLDDDIFADDDDIFAEESPKDMDLDATTITGSTSALPPPSVDLHKQLEDLEQKQAEIGIKLFRASDEEAMTLMGEGKMLAKAIDDLKRRIDTTLKPNDTLEATKVSGPVRNSPYFRPKGSNTHVTTTTYTPPAATTTYTPPATTTAYTPPATTTAYTPPRTTYTPPATAYVSPATPPTYTPVVSYYDPDTSSFISPSPAPTTSTSTRMNVNRPLSPSINSSTAPRREATYHPPAAEDSYPWSKDVRRMLTQVFHLTDFRRHQLEAINTTLRGEDVFVLMPTGGGKSLCYQLPATMQQGRYGDKQCRIGVTVVVSPLLSLMQDQVDHLKQRGIPADLLGSHVGIDERRAVYAGLAGAMPSLQLVYVTPELIQRSEAFQNTLRRLFDNDRLARFVIDEAHCVSQWGHDFRPDYKLLGNLKSTYPGIPIIALTATANQRVQHDLMANLNITGCKVFKQSFNRPNLKYEIVSDCTRHNARMEDIKDFINTRYRNKCGIIYCVSKKLCEDVAAKLRDNYGLRTTHYHAGMTQEERTDAQQKWQCGDYQVIVATIAFGMGIDKPDVRFVIHYSLPSSIEGYYQETGRAGRDGMLATCRLYYSYADSKTHAALIDSGEGGFDQKKCQRDNLNSMMQYCSNTVDCRRKQVLAYFGEMFDPAQCKEPTCDNCINNQGKVAYDKDVTHDSRSLIQLCHDVCAMRTSGYDSEKITLIQLVDAFRGVKKKAFSDRGYNMLQSFGSGKHITKTDATRMAQHLQAQGYLHAYTEPNYVGFNTTYVTLGQNSDRLLSGQDVVIMREVTESVPRRSRAPLPTPPARPPPRIPYPRSHQGPSRPLHLTPTTPKGPGFQSPAAPTPSPSLPSRRSLPSSMQDPTPPPSLELQTTCFYEMVKVRNELKARHKLAQPSTIFSDNELKVMATHLPDNIKTFVELTNMQDEKYNRYGTIFLDISKRYAAKLGR